MKNMHLSDSRTGIPQSKSSDTKERICPSYLMPRHLHAGIAVEELHDGVDGQVGVLGTCRRCDPECMLRVRDDLKLAPELLNGVYGPRHEPTLTTPMHVPGTIPRKPHLQYQHSSVTARK